jgi:MtaA/CmuA family methyltransferase
MTKKQRLEELFLTGKNKDGFLFRPILMHFAARYIGKSYREFASDHKVLVEANLRCLEDFDIDAVGLISDPYRETSAFGARVTFPEEGVPQCLEPLVNTYDDVKDLKNPDVHKSERTLDRINGAKLLAREVGGNVPIIGWVEGPLAEACDLASVNEMLLKLMIEPDFVKLVTDKALVTAKDFAKAQIEAGCDIIGIGDAICSQISSEDYREFIKEKHHELISYIQSLGARVKLHICGNITHLLSDIREVGPDIVDLDSMVDMDEAHQLLGGEIVRCGNLNPVSVIQQKTPEEISREVKALCDKEKERKFILSGGCEITVQTPPENLMAMRRASRAVST